MEDKDKQIADLQAQMAQLQGEKTALETKLQSGDTRLPIPGSYKGHKFDDGHARVRNQSGEKLNSAELLAAAKEKDAAAIKVLDWLIESGYAHFKKA